jgi:PilZ domain
VSRTKKTAEGSPRGSSRRAEQRLRYRWPVRFTTNANQKQPFSGQLVDVSSQGMALLFHADKSCPHPDQLVTAGFGVPYFDSHGSFDTVFFNRVARVRRVDNLNSRVNRVAVQFTEPLFFKPGEQDISEADAQQRLDAKARSVAPASPRPGPHDATASTAKTRQKARTKGGKGVKGEAAKAEARRRARSCAEQISKVKAEVAREIARITAEAAEAIARIEAQFDAGAATCDEAQSCKKSTTYDTDRSEERGLMKKVDTFLTNRSTVF